ncbi:MAG TPA: ATP-binding protein [Thermomicrobiales bacterium]|nr:ATP-binding protein [Thermomicrobiales bacterium]
MTRRWSLRTRFVAAASLCLLPLLGVVLFVLDQSLEHSQEQLLDTEVTIADTVAQGLSITLADNESVLSNLAASEQVRAMNAPATQDRFNQVIRLRTNIYGLFLADPTGTIVTSAGSITPEPFLAEFGPALQTALGPGNKIGVSDPIDVPGSEDNDAITIVVPVLAEDEKSAEGKPIGAIGAFLSIDRLQRTFVQPARFASNDTTIAVVGQNGVVVAPQNTLVQTVKQTELLQGPIAVAVGGQRGQSTYSDANGHERLAVLAPVDYQPASWAVLVTSPSPTAYGPNRALLERGLIALGGAVLLTLILAVIFGELTARPLRQLTSQAAAISKGDFSHPVRSVGRGEIATLSASFADMARRLTSQVRDVEAARAEVEVQAERLRELLRRTVRLQEDERRRIAAEIHDAVSPLITGALYQARAIQLSVDGHAHMNGTNGEHANGNGNGNGDANGKGAQRPPDANGTSDGYAESLGSSLTAVTELLERAMADLHDVIFSLRPPDLDDLGIVAAIDRYVRQINRTGLPARLEVSGDPQRVSPEARLGIYRVVQEALHNALRHAQADEAVVKLEWMDDLLRVTIRDNGSGFDPEQAARPTSLGLLSMHERAAAIGAKLEISSRPGGGTAVILERPLDTELVLEPLVDTLPDDDGNGVPADGEPAASPANETAEAAGVKTS